MQRLVIAFLAAGLAAGLGACGQSLSEVKVDDSKNAQSVQVHVGDTVKVTLGRSSAIRSSRQIRSGAAYLGWAAG